MISFILGIVTGVVIMLYTKDSIQINLGGKNNVQNK